MENIQGEQGISIVDRGDFPAGLSELGDCPDRLFVRGEIPDGPMVALVGSRKADPRYVLFTQELAAELVAARVTIISGGALGIDTAAHRGAIKAGGRTVAVIGSGFDNIYPKGNAGLFDEISKKGAVISEFEPQVHPTKWTFPRRNRLVAAMSHAVVVVQAAARSGALITTRIAGDLNVPIGAVPGAPFEPGSRGCNALIRSGAAVIRSAKDVLELMGETPAQSQLGLPGIVSQGMEASSKAPVGLSEDEEAVWQVAGSNPLHVDEITNLSGLDVSRTTAALLNLELAGFVVDRGGKFFVRVE